HSAPHVTCPLYTRKRHKMRHIGMSAKGPISGLRPMPVPIFDVNIKDNLVSTPDAANSMLANVGFAAVQKPTFYRKRAQVAEGFAKRCRDETAKHMLQRVAERWRELARLAGSRKSSRASSKPKKRKPR